MSSRFARLFALHCSIAVGLAATATTGCGGGAATCFNDDQCASHVCGTNGVCATSDGTDAATGSNDATNTGGSDAANGLCVPNNDGHITANEVPLNAGRSAKFLIATNATTNTAGTSNADGTRTWDLSTALSGDADSTISLTSPTGAWWASSFPSATYATVLASGSTDLGVFEVSATEVTLLGVVSPTAGTGQTLLSYSPAAKILVMPFSNGSTWTSTSTVTGTLEGITSDYTEEYTSSVDASGTMKTPYGTFPVLRVGTDLTRSSGLETLETTRTFAWVAECFGTVATIVSNADESGDEFTSAAEVERLAP